MSIRDTLTKKSITAISTVAILTAAGSGYALLNNADTSATQEAPIQKQVRDHEGRIVNLENDNDKTKADVSRNTNDIQANKTDIATNGTRIASTEAKQASNPPANQSGSSQSPPAQPAPVQDPYTVLSVKYTYIPVGTNGSQYPAVTCVYKTLNGETWWTGTRSNSVKDTGVCQYGNQPILTDSIRRNLTNRPIDM